MQEWSLEQYLAHMRANWKQGQHIGLIGPTGVGKTTLAHEVLQFREYVCVLAVKRKDETLEKFKKGHQYGYRKYVVIRKWPPEYTEHAVILWAKPESIASSALYKQSETIHAALGQMYISGGWTPYFDEAGYISGQLGLFRDLTILLNQGRSSNISVAVSMTRPRSMAARVPVEALNQCKHYMLFKYSDEREIKTCGEITGITHKDMIQLMQELGKYDFLYSGPEQRAIVRNTH